VWRSCVSNKCQANDSTTVEQCPKDLDCESSCTEDASSEKGVLSCCLGGPQHNNSCPSKINGTCTAGQTSPSVYPPGSQYNEWDKVPPTNMPILDSDNNFDSAAVISPDYPLAYPEGTTFDEFGMPSNPPLSNPAYSMTNIPPGYNPPSPLAQIPEYPTELRLPPEYQPATPYVPSIGGGLIDSNINFQQIPPSDNGASLTAPLAPEEAPFAPSQSTFSQNTSASPQSSESLCTFSLFGFCLWR
jgi:hypothetical protein